MCTLAIKGAGMKQEIKFALMACFDCLENFSSQAIYR